MSLTITDLYTDHFTSISNFLCYVDVFALRVTCKTLHRKVRNKDFRQIFIQKLIPIFYWPDYQSIPYQISLEEYETIRNHTCSLEEAVQRATDFTDNLFKCGAYVSGSFMLDCLYDTDYHNDIDVYDEADPNKTYMGDITQWRSVFKFGDRYNRFNQYLYRANFMNSENSDTGKEAKVIRNYLFMPPNLIDSRVDHRNVKLREPNDNERYFIGDDGKYIYPIAQHHLYRHAVQIIPLCTQIPEHLRSRVEGHHYKLSIPGTIYATYDLDICKNVFDGKNLYVRSWSKLFKRKDYIKPNTRLLMRQYSHTTKHSEDTVDWRRAKYLQRGFTIDLHPQFNEMKQIIDLKLNNLPGRLEYNRYHPDLQDVITYIIDRQINLDTYYTE